MFLNFFLIYKVSIHNSVYIYFLPEKYIFEKHFWKTFKFENTLYTIGCVFIYILYTVCSQCRFIINYEDSELLLHYCIRVWIKEVNYEMLLYLWWTLAFSISQTDQPLCPSNLRKCNFATNRRGPVHDLHKYENIKKAICI